jgi:uncharacterized protein with FMN-binding domain
MRRAPAVLLATVAGTAALVTFHPRGPAGSTAAGAKVAVAGARTSDGLTEQTRYGPVKVRVSVRGGRVVDVAAVELPGNEPRSTQINDVAGPLLRQEALKAQSASIDVVSGATYTSEAYEVSLKSALEKAGV